MPLIQSAHNPHIKHLAKLLNAAKARREHRQTVLEGVHLLAAYLQSGGKPLHLYIPESRTRHPEIQSCLNRLPECPVSTVSDNVMQKTSSLHQACDIMTLIALPEHSAAPVQGDCIVLDRIQDPGNIGTVIRSAAASGIKQLVLSEGCADAYSPKVLRAGMGAHFLLDICEHINLAQWLPSYRSRKLATALGSTRPASLYRLNLSAENAWLFGNEGSGIAPELLDLCDAAVHIPMQGQTESLNIAMAATVCLFEQMRQRLQAA